MCMVKGCHSQSHPIELGTNVLPTAVAVVSLISESWAVDTNGLGSLHNIRSKRLHISALGWSHNSQYYSGKFKVGI